MAFDALPGCGWISPTIGKAISLLQAHLPTGAAWLAWRIPGKNAYKLISALARAYDDAIQFMCKVESELDPRTTEELITEWEAAVGLPDPCLPKATTLEERRAWIMFRLTKRRWSTAQDWHDLAALYGLTIAITPGWYVQWPQLFEYRFPVGFDLFPKLGRFRVYIDVLEQDFAGFEYGSPGVNGNAGFPIPFGSTDDKLTRFMCMIDRIRPANVIVIWNEFPTTDERSCTRPTFDPDLFASPFC